MTCGALADGATCMSVMCGSTEEVGYLEEIGVSSPVIIDYPSECTGHILSDDSVLSVFYSFEVL